MSSYLNGDFEKPPVITTSADINGLQRLPTPREVAEQVRIREGKLNDIERVVAVPWYAAHGLESDGSLYENDERSELPYYEKFALETGIPWTVSRDAIKDARDRKWVELGSGETNARAFTSIKPTAAGKRYIKNYPEIAANVETVITRYRIGQAQEIQHELNCLTGESKEFDVSEGDLSLLGLNRRIKDLQSEFRDILELVDPVAAKEATSVDNNIEAYVREILAKRT